MKKPNQAEWVEVRSKPSKPGRKAAKVKKSTKSRKAKRARKARGPQKLYKPFKPQYTVREKKVHYPQLKRALRSYAEARLLDFHMYSPWHMRIMYAEFVCLDVWTTGKYYVKETNYCDMEGKQTVERGGEKGQFILEEFDKFEELYKFLDDLFYAPFAD